MKNKIQKLSVTLGLVLFFILFIVIFHFTVKDPPIVSDATGTLTYFQDTTEKKAVAGEDFTAISISDLNDLNQISKVNYIPNVFVDPSSLSEDIQIVDLTKPFEFAEKGTLMFIILNLDPNSETFNEQAASLDKYLIGENWEFTLSLPPIFSASNIYLRSQLISKSGEIEDYNFIEYTTSYDIVTDHFSKKTEYTNVDLQFYSRRIAMSQNFNSAKVITIHYQNDHTIVNGLKSLPLIGKGTIIDQATNCSDTLLFGVAIISILIWAVFIILSLLMKTNQFISLIILLSGILIMTFSSFIINEACSIPNFWIALSSSSIFIILIGSINYICSSYKKYKFQYGFNALCIIGFILTIISCFIPYQAGIIMQNITQAIGFLAMAFLFFLATYEFFKKNSGHNYLKFNCAYLTIIILISSVVMPKSVLSQSDPLLWLLILLVLETFIYVFILFYEMEKEKMYLTNNLHLEVNRQLKELKSIVHERDSLLQFVSHDMKKPLTSSMSLMNTLIKREENLEQVKGLRIIKQNTQRVISNLSEIGTYAKFNYLAEPPKVIDLYDLCKQLFEFHEPDCIANGIILKNQVSKSFKVFAKMQGLENAASNIILNAIEHANCNTIILSAKRDKDRVVLTIQNDGREVNPELDLFKPYTSEDKNSSGLGLYICKSIVESMNGEISFESQDNKTEFYISLLKA